MNAIIEARHNEIHPELMRLAQALQWGDDPEKAVRTIRTVLHALRDLLPLDDAIAVLMLLPHPMRGVFVENWNTADLPSLPPETTDFLRVVRGKAGKLAVLDFATAADTAQAVQTLFDYMADQLQPGQLHQLSRRLPALVRPYVPVPGMAL